MTARTGGIGLALIVFAVLGALLFGPQQLGGPVAVVSTYGTSMLPTYRASDLVIVVEAPRYEVGDVVAYRSDELGAVVLHRIVDIDDDGYVTQGDNNDWLDPDRPTDEELMGTARLRLPGAGRLLDLPTPVRAGAVTALAGLVLFGGRQVKRRRTRRPVSDIPGEPLLAYARRRRATRRSRRPADAAEGRGFTWVGWPLTTALVAVVVAVLALALAVVAFSRPATGPGELAYTHRGEFTYAADAPGGAVYPTGEVTTGDPIFLQLIDELDLAFSYELDGPGAVETSGQLWVELANGSGWSSRFALSDQQSGHAGTLLLEGTLDVPQLRRTLEGVQEETGVVAGGATITVTAEIEVAGSVADEPVSDRLSPQLALQFDEARLIPQAETDAAGDDEPADADTRRELVRSQLGSVTLPNAEPARLELVGQGIDVAAARVVGLTVLGLALLALGVAVAAAARQHGLDEASQIKLRYGRRIIEVAALELPPGYGIVDVRDVADLVALADRVDRPVLHHRSSTIDTYLVEGDAAVYRHRIELPPHPGSAEGAIDQDPSLGVLEAHPGMDADNLSSHRPDSA